MTIKEEVVEAEPAITSSAESSSSASDNSIGHAPRDGVDYDSSKMSY